MPPTTSAPFIALQCFQCSTLQVKQQRKSSNKWTCVMCNEKQSVRKVYAQGSMAKDVRKFVQSFNMSRKFIDEEKNLSAKVPYAEEVAGGSCPAKGRKRRSDWSEYLDPREDVEEEEEEEEERDMEGEIVNEKSEEMFKKAKLKNQNQSTGLQSKGDGKALPLKPIFPLTKTSKWCEYMTEEEQYKETMSTSMAAGFDFEAPPPGNDSQMVEDEIHPDFMYNP